MTLATRTIGPLHLEDLEPHRFEDLVRQLAYDFRPWRQLEATGRSGSDDSYDARGWEKISDVELLDIEEDKNTEPTSPETPDRLWLIQCKREKSIGPKQLREYLDDIPAADRGKIHGIVFAAACDFSMKAREAFREKARAFGFAEAHLWGKAEIEDQLFQPKNDHLLFAYTGISLQIRQRTLKSIVRAKLVMKRRAENQLKDVSFILIRDASDERYPYLDKDKTKTRINRGHWMVFSYQKCMADGVGLLTARHFAFVDDNGVNWDYAEAMNDAKPSPYEDPWTDSAKNEELNSARSEAMKIWEALPEKNKAWLEIVSPIPYEKIIDIDKAGDEFFSSPHLYVVVENREKGPFDKSWLTLELIGYASRSATPDEKNRVQLFSRKKK